MVLCSLKHIVHSLLKTLFLAWLPGHPRLQVFPLARWQCFLSPFADFSFLPQILNAVAQSLGLVLIDTPLGFRYLLNLCLQPRLHPKSSDSDGHPTIFSKSPHGYLINFACLKPKSCHTHQLSLPSQLMATSSFTWLGPKALESSLLFASLPICKQICQFLLKVYLKTNCFSPFPQPPASFKPSSSLSWLSQLLPAFLAFIFAPLQLVLKTGDNMILSKLVFVTPLLKTFQ